MKCWDVNMKMCLSMLLIAILLPLESLSANRRIIELRSGPINGPPNRPDQFKSVAELNQYLADLAEYYKMMSRPRFGKRSQEYASPLVDDFTNDRAMANDATDYAPAYLNLWRSFISGYRQI